MFLCFSRFLKAQILNVVIFSQYFRHTAEPDNILEYEETCDTSTEILIPNEFDVVIEEPNIEMGR